ESRERLAYLEALVARAESNWYAVIDVLQPVVAGRVSNPELGKGLWRLLAEAFSRTDQSRRAVHALTTYLRNDPGNPEMTLQLAKEYLRLRDWNRAVETARLAEPLNPADFMIRLLRIEASVYAAVDQQQEPTEATFSKLLEELAQLRADHPDQVDIRIVQALVADHLKQPDKAEAELKLAIEECKEPLRAEMQLAAHYYREKDIDKAIGVCETACERHSAVAEPWLSLASLHTAKEDDRAARSCLKQGLQAAAGKWERRSLSIQLALLEFTQGDPNAGIERLSDLAEQDPQEIRARSLLLTILHAQTDQAKAQKLIEELRKAEGQSGLQWRMHQARLWLGSEEWRSKQQDIVNLLRACIDSDPQWSTPPLLLADMYEKLNDLQQVETVYRQALARNPSATDITDRLVTLLERQRRFSDAEEVLQQGEADPRVTSAYRVRRDLREGEFARATEELKLRAANNDRDADSRILLARLVYWQTRDAAQSLKYVAEAEAIAPYSLALTGVKAAILRADDRADEAQKVLDDYVQQRKDFDAYQLRAAYLAREGESEKAERDYKKLTTVGDARNRVLGYLLLSNFYAERNDPNQAVATLKESLDAYPEDLNLKRGLMRLLFRRARGEDRNKAVEILTALETRLPQDPELMRLRAVLLLEEPTIESVGKARAILETVVKLEPTAVDAHLLLIGLAMQASEHQAARDYAIRALGSNLNNRDLLAARARAELALENAPLAGQLARLILQEDPNHTEAISMLLDAGQRSSNSSLLEEARTRIEAAVRRAPTNEKLLLSRARILTALNQPKAAIPELETYSQTAQGNGNIAVLVTLADLHRLTGDVDRSKQWIEQAQRLDPSNQTVTHARLLWLVSQNRWAELKGIGSAYLSAPAQDPALLVRAGSILAVASEMELKKEGLQLFERAAVLSPTSVDARLGLASTLYQTGDAERAEKIYKDVLGQHPTNVRALNDLAWILQEHYKRYEDALKLADKGLKLAPKDRNLLDTRGTILMNLPDRLADAKNDFQELAGLWPDDTRGKGRALFQLGCVCAKMNDLAQAKEHLQKALEIARKIMETDPKADIFTADERAEIAKIIQEAEK
ncbi:MAG: tetratricopeptide repeat protein, partial [Planctomycetes bacterium]|nr:tetratricopeptide repeat protein [Planctomycetota bacterium]